MAVFTDLIADSLVEAVVLIVVFGLYLREGHIVDLWGSNTIRYLGGTTAVAVVYKYLGRYYRASSRRKAREWPQPIPSIQVTTGTTEAPSVAASPPTG